MGGVEKKTYSKGRQYVQESGHEDIRLRTRQVPNGQSCQPSKESCIGTRHQDAFPSIHRMPAHVTARQVEVWYVQSMNSDSGSRHVAVENLFLGWDPEMRQSFSV